MVGDGGGGARRAALARDSAAGTRVEYRTRTRAYCADAPASGPRDPSSFTPLSDGPFEPGTLP